MIVHEAGPRLLRIRLDAALYNEATVFKCFYWYGKDFDVVVDREEDGRALCVTLTPRHELDEDEVKELISRVMRDLIDFKTRDIIAQETQAIRELLVAKAFASSDELDEPPLGNITDLGSFSPAAPFDAAQ